jgi:hypothetical protein
MPWVDGGETYLSHWQFQLRTDFEEFCRRYLYTNNGYAPNLPPSESAAEELEDHWDVH